MLAHDREREVRCRRGRRAPRAGRSATGRPRRRAASSRSSSASHSRPGCRRPRSRCGRTRGDGRRSERCRLAASSGRTSAAMNASTSSIRSRRASSVQLLVHCSSFAGALSVQIAWVGDFELARTRCGARKDLRVAPVEASGADRAGELGLVGDADRGQRVRVHLGVLLEHELAPDHAERAQRDAQPGTRRGRRAQAARRRRARRGQAWSSSIVVGRSCRLAGGCGARRADCRSRLRRAPCGSSSRAGPTRPRRRGARSPRARPSAWPPTGA